MAEILEIIKAIVLGVIQGITEWLPISSTGHLILFNSIWPMNDPAFFEMFKVVIQFGSILAVCVLFFHKLNPFSPRKNKTAKVSTLKLWLKVIIGAIPAGVVGILFDDIIDSKLSIPFIIALTLIIYGIIFIVIERKKPIATIKKLDDLDYKTAFMIGCFQVLALVPGTSRSGATILGGIVIGCSRYVASEFSFFLAAPIMAGASLLKIIKFGFNFTFIQVIVLIIGTLVSFLISVIAIKMLLGYIRKHDFKVFGYYRIVLGIIVLLYFGLTGGLF